MADYKTELNNYSATSNTMKLVHWPLIGGLLHFVQQRGDWAGPQPAQSPPHCTKCNSPSVNSHCTNHRIYCCIMVRCSPNNTKALASLRLWHHGYFVGRLRSGVWISATSEIVAIITRRNVLGGKGNCLGGGISGGICRNMSERGIVQGEMCYTWSYASSDLVEILSQLNATCKEFKQLKG